MTDEQWRAALDRRLTEIEKELQELKRDDAVAAFRWETVERRLSGIESGQTWVVRLILGVLVTTILTFAFSGGFTGFGQ